MEKNKLISKNKSSSLPYLKKVGDAKGKVPPQAVALEEAIIGSMLIDSAAIDSAMLVIKKPEVFYKTAHQYIFKAILDLLENDSGIDLLTVSDQLRKNGQLDLIGGDFYLVKLSQITSSGAHTELHSRLVLQYWVKRKLITDSSDLIDKAYDDTADIFNILEYQENNIDEINETISTGQKQLSWNEAIENAVKRVELISSLDESELTGITTGFKKIDKFTGGWQPTDLIIIAARPGMGKTALVLKTISAAAINGDPVGMFSLEMSAQQLATRTISINSHLHLRQLFRDGFKDDKQDEYFQKLIKVKGSLLNLPIYIDDRGSLTINELVMQARIWKRKHGIKLLVIDYLQLMGGDSDNREMEVAKMSRRLKQLAKELKIPIIALSQLSREVEKRGDKRPKLSDLRESGALEQDADIVCFIYRPKYYGLEPADEIAAKGGNTEFIFAKFRNGSLGPKALWFDENKTKFVDAETDQDDLPF